MPADERHRSVVGTAVMGKAIEAEDSTEGDWDQLARIGAGVADVDVSIGAVATGRSVPLARRESAGADHQS